MKKISQLERQLNEARQRNDSLVKQLQGYHGDFQSADSDTSKDLPLLLSEQVSENFIFEKEEEEIIRELRVKCEARSQQIKSLEMKNADLIKQAKHCETNYHIEVEENLTLKSEIKKLKHNLDTLSSEEYIEDTNSEEEKKANYKRVLGVLRKQVDDLSDDLVKVRDHSKEQSRQILNLRQQTEMTEV